MIDQSRQMHAHVRRVADAAKPPVFALIGARVGKPHGTLRVNRYAGMMNTKKVVVHFGLLYEPLA